MCVLREDLEAACRPCEQGHWDFLSQHASVNDGEAANEHVNKAGGDGPKCYQTAPLEINLKTA